MTEPLTPEARLAALLHDVTHGLPDRHWEPPVDNYCERWATRLIAAGVALDAARQPAPEAALRHAHPSVHPSQCEACAALAATPTPDADHD